MNKRKPRCLIAAFAVLLSMNALLLGQTTTDSIRSGSLIADFISEDELRKTTDEIGNVWPTKVDEHNVFDSKVYVVTIQPYSGQTIYHCYVYQTMPNKTITKLHFFSIISGDSIQNEIDNSSLIIKNNLHEKLVSIKLESSFFKR
jgi:hypothetical protein